MSGVWWVVGGVLGAGSGGAGPVCPDREAPGTGLGGRVSGVGGRCGRAGIGGLTWGFAGGVGLVAGCAARGVVGGCWVGGLGCRVFWSCPGFVDSFRLVV